METYYAIKSILLTVLGGLLFINHMRLKRAMRDAQSDNYYLNVRLTHIRDDIKRMGELNVAGIESMTDTTIKRLCDLDKRLNEVQDAPDKAEVASRTAHNALRMMNELGKELQAEASIEAMAAARQIAENMIAGKSAEMMSRLERVEQACRPLPDLRQFRQSRDMRMTQLAAQINAKKVNSPFVEPGDKMREAGFKLGGEIESPPNPLSDGQKAAGFKLGGEIKFPRRTRGCGPSDTQRKAIQDAVASELGERAKTPGEAPPSICPDNLCSPNELARRAERRANRGKNGPKA